MKHRMTRSGGFTLLELVVAIAVLGVVSIAATGMVFASLSLRDKVSATTRTMEAIRVWSHVFRQAVIGASIVTSSSTDRLQTSSNTDCWSFWFSQDNLLYSHVTAPGCIPDPNPSNPFFAVQTSVSDFAFEIDLLATGGRQVKATGTIETALPMDNYSADYSETVVNVVD